MTITEAMAELDRLKPGGVTKISVEFWRYESGDNWTPEWEIWDGKIHFRSDSLDGVIAKFRGVAAPTPIITDAVKSLEGQS